MLVLVITAFASAVFAALALVFFYASWRNGDFEQAERLSLLPLRSHEEER